MSNQTNPPPDDTHPIVRTVLAWMEMENVSGRQMAKMAGLSPSYFSTWKTGNTKQPSTYVVEKLSKVMNIDLFDYARRYHPTAEIEHITPKFHGGGPPAGNLMVMPHFDNTPANARKLGALPHVAYQDYANSVPVYGVTTAGNGEFFNLNGEIVDYVYRPPGIAQAKRAYALYVVGSSMEPVYPEGTTVYVNPDKPPALGDHVVIELDMDTQGEEAGPSFIKRLVKRGPDKIICNQFNPPMEINFTTGDIKRMHRVVPWNELLGI